MHPALKLSLPLLFGIAANSHTCFADSLLAMSGPLVANSDPFAFDAGAFGKFQIDGAVSGLAFLQDNSLPADRHSVLDLDNGEIFVQSSGSWLQLFAALGTYSFPSLGTAYLDTSRTSRSTYSYAPEAIAKILLPDGLSVEAGKLPSLIGDESVFTIENIDLERGLLWNQTPTISRGVQLNYASGPLSLSLSWNDGFYSNRFNWIAGSAAFALAGNAGMITLIGGANLGHTAYSDFATPLAQNNSAIVDLAYSAVLGSWTINPYLQFAEIPKDGAAELSGHRRTEGAAMLLIRKLNDDWSLGARCEYLASEGDINLLYGVGSSSWSLTLTPTYQKGVLFARAEASYVALFHGQAGSEFGRKADSNSQARLMFETGILF